MTELLDLCRRHADKLEKVPSMRVFPERQQNDKECCQEADAVGMPNSKLTI